MYNHLKSFVRFVLLSFNLLLIFVLTIVFRVITLLQMSRAHVRLQFTHALLNKLELTCEEIAKIEFGLAHLV